ncbi:MAG TPA: hypothetical protein VMJ34_07050 [Bryobacteraceae bacterium]|nr:hypothetical protein [Bryobacteraceae bacterium]
MNRNAIEVIPAPRPVPSARAEEFRLQLERILSSQIFRSSQRCQVLLRHIGERAASGDTGSLKERTLGIDVFGREPDYDTSQQPIVRATAAEIRKKLAQYYQQEEHAAEPRIELATGTYIPEYRDLGEVSSPGKNRRPMWLAAIGGVVIGALLTVSGYVLAPAVNRTPLDQFWQPVLEATGSVLCGLGESGVYTLQGGASEKVWWLAHKAPPGALLESKETIPVRDILPMGDRYYAVGDVNSMLHVAALFEKRGKPYLVYGGEAIKFDELREHPAVLIGALNNPWAMRATGKLRYTFGMDGEATVVRDAEHPDALQWRVNEPWPQKHITMDYAIVSRVFDVTTDRIVVAAGGITEHGTAAAGEFISNPEYFADAAARLPSGWAKKNLQVVLSIPVVQGAPGRPRVLATHVW